MGDSIPPAFQGQHKRTASSVPSASISQKSARLEHDVLANETSSAASPLERLPTEILEMIFMYSLNLSLPRASPTLGKRLASNHMKTNLFLLVFPSEDEKLRHIDYLLDILGTEESIGNLQSDILALKWATPAYVCDLMEPFVVGTIVYVFRNHGLGWLNRNRKADLVGEMMESLEGDLDRGILDVTEKANTDVVSRFYKRVLKRRKVEEAIFSHTDSIERMWSTGTGSGMLYMNIEFREAKMLFSTHEFEVPPKGSMDVHSRLIFCAAGVRIPARLLHGPWFDDKCTELLRVSRGGGRIDQTGSTMDEEIADSGLREAIIEENEKAIVALIGSITMYRSQTSLTGEDHCSTCHSILNSPDPTHGTHCEAHIHKYCVGLTVRTEHVKLALNKDCTYRVLYMLLDGMKISLDWSDNELTAWAVERRREDDERGQWLLDRLASSNFARYEEEARNRRQEIREREEDNVRKENARKENLLGGSDDED